MTFSKVSIVSCFLIRFLLLRPCTIHLSFRDLYIHQSVRRHLETLPVFVECLFEIEIQ